MHPLRTYTLAEATLVSTQDDFNSVLDPVQYNESKDHARDAQIGNASVVVALG